MAHQFLSFLKRRLKQPLPGKRAHRIMAPAPDGGRLRDIDAHTGSGKSAVLVPFTLDKSGRLRLLFTLRSRHMPQHKGQISFPGGRCDPLESLEQTALREAHEEVGINADAVRVIGALSPVYVPPSDSIINPLVGYIQNLPELTELRICKEEVAEVFTVSIDTLCSESFRRKETRVIRGQNYLIPYWEVHETPLWGATAMITSEVTELYREFLEQIHRK